MIDHTGISYLKDMEHKINKAKHAISTIKWTKYVDLFRKSYSLFYKCCIMPIIGYGAELYDCEQILNLELTRKDLLKMMHGGKYRFPELCFKYLNMPLYKSLKLISLNNQLLDLNIPQIPNDFTSKDDVFAANLIRVQVQWDQQPGTQRASQFKSDSIIVRLATTIRLPNHLKQLVDEFLLGNLPFKKQRNKTPICKHCNREFINLNHFSLECSEEEYISRSSIYSELNSNNSTVIFNRLKMIRDSIEIQYTPTNDCQ